jgi:hypothetical protein
MMMMHQLLDTVSLYLYFHNTEFNFFIAHLSCSVCCLMPNYPSSVILVPTLKHPKYRPCEKSVQYITSDYVVHLYECEYSMWASQAILWINRAFVNYSLLCGHVKINWNVTCPQKLLIERTLYCYPLLYVPKLFYWVMIRIL